MCHKAFNRPDALNRHKCTHKTVHL